MSLSDANVIQENSDKTAVGTSHAISLSGTGTTAGNTVLIYTYPGTFSAVPSGFVLDAGGADIGVYRKSDVTAGEGITGSTPWTFTTATSVEVDFYVKEVSNVDLIEPLDVTATGSSGSLANGGTLSTGTTARTAGLSVMVDVIYATSSGGTVSWSDYTNGFTEVADVDGTNNSLAVATKYVDGTTTTLESTATLASSANVPAWARIVAYRAADAPLAAPLYYFTGYEWGTYGGMGNGGTANPQASSFAPSGTAGTTYLVQSSSARNAGYGLRVTVSAAVSAVDSATISPAASGVAFGFNCRVVSATGVATIAYVSATTPLKVVYDGSTNKFGLQWGSGTVSYQSDTTALNTWAWIDVRVKFTTNAWHADWRIETGTNTYTNQTSPSDLANSASTTGLVSLGAAEASTMTVDYDDFVLTKYYAAYPLGPHEVRVLVPATTGASVVGTSTNFSKFTANGTLAAWGSDAGALLDEVPPTVSASADGVVQTAVATSDYMEFPMTDPVLASDEVFGGARAVFATWGGTGTGTGTLWLAVYNGTTETVIDAGSTAYDGDSLTAVSATYPIWRSQPSGNKVIPAPAGGWTPTAANALKARVGKSSDATPDMGVNAVYIEYARRKATTSRQITIEDPIPATVDALVNPYNSASVSYVVTNNDAIRSVNFNYSISGTPQTPVTVGPASSQTVTVNADSFGDVNPDGLEPQ